MTDNKASKKIDFNKLSDTEKEEIVITKYLLGEPMTLAETAYAVWMEDGRKTPKPMSTVAIHKIEKRALAKLRKAMSLH